MGVYKIKPVFQKSIEPVANLCIQLHLTPFQLNIGGLFFSISIVAVFWCFSSFHYLLLYTPFAVFGRLACNALDGMIARKMHLSSQFGEFINEFLDRISDMIILGSIGFFKHGEMSLTLIAAITTLLNSYIGIASKAVGAHRQYGGFMGKADRMIIIGLFSVLSFFCTIRSIWNIMLVIIAVGSIISMVQRTESLKKELECK